MFNVGDKICYPMHGAGQIEAIEEKEVFGNLGMYYVLYFYCDGIKIMVPVENAIKAGLRKVIPKEQIPAVYEQLSRAPKADDTNWNRRYRQNLEKMREGDPFSIAEVVKSLYARNERRGLSAGEKKMLVSGRRFLLGELLMAGGGEEAEIEQRIEQCLQLETEEV